MYLTISKFKQVLRSRKGLDYNTGLKTITTGSMVIKMIQAYFTLSILPLEYQNVYGNIFKAKGSHGVLEIPGLMIQLGFQPVVTCFYKHFYITEHLSKSRLSSFFCSDIIKREGTTLAFQPSS